MINNPFQNVLRNFSCKRNKTWVDKVREFYNKSMKMKLLDVKPSTYIDFNVDNNYKDSIFNFGDYVIISKYMNIYGKIKNTAPWTYVINGQL